MFGALVVTIASLAAGQTVSGVVPVQASVNGAVQRIEVSVDGRLRSVMQPSSLTWSWDTSVESNGMHTINLWAVARDGTVGTASVTVDVENSFQVSLPSLGDRLTGSVRLAPQLTGLPAQWLEVRVDSELRWTLSRAPFAVDWDTALETPGTHTITIRGVAVGGFVSQASLTVTVGEGQAATRQTLLAQTLKFRAQTWTLQGLMRAPRTPSSQLQGRLAELVLWRSRAAAARAKASAPPHLDEWMCIHSHEASWTNHDTGRNGHYGGLQMSFDFMKGYGPELFAAKGTADHWTPLEQLWVAERAWQVRGFRPWPTTARMCGLLQ